MKFFKVKTEIPFPSEGFGKISIGYESKSGEESIWYANIDGEKFFANNALTLLPYPSWGSRIDNTDSAKTIEKGEMYFHPKAWEKLEKYVGEDNEFDLDLYYKETQK